MNDVRPYPGIIGLNLYFDFDDISEDISTAITKQIKAKIGSTEKIWLPTALSSTRLLYTTVAGDIDIDGVWYLQPYLVFPSGFNPYCYTVSLKVYDYYQ